MRNRKLIFTWVLVVTVGLIYSVHLLEPPRQDWCTGLEYLPSNRPTTSVHPIKVVVEPWLGRHQIYGIFQIESKRCYFGKPAVLTVVGAGKYCEGVYIFGQHLEGIEAPPGYYLTKHYIRTRTALRLTTQGLLNQLKQPRNWTLTYGQ